MSMETFSQKRHRIYPRAFDHDEAQVLHAAGASPSELATHYGVSETAIRRVLFPVQRARMAANTQRWAEKNLRKPCIAGCGHKAWHFQGRTGLCLECWNKQRRAANPNVREGELRCTSCGEWKPDDGFATTKNNRTRRGRRTWCTSCDSAKRRAHREARPDLEAIATARHRQHRHETSTAEMAQEYVIYQSKNGSLNEVARASGISPAHALEGVVTEAGEYVVVGENGRLRVEPVTALRVTKKAAV